MQTGRISTSKMPFTLLVAVRLEKSISCMMKEKIEEYQKHVILQVSLLKNIFQEHHFHYS